MADLGARFTMRANHAVTIRPPSSTPDDDLALLARLRGGDAQAFATLVDRHHGPMVRLAQVFVRDRAAAEDAVQETWIGVIAGLPRFEPRARLKTWIYGILVNQARSRARRDGRDVPFSALVEADGDVAAAVDAARFKAGGHWASPPADWVQDTPESLLATRGAAEVIGAAIDALPPAQRAVLTLRDLEGATSEEVCNILEVSEINQRVLLHRARTRVRAALEQFLQKK